MVQHYKKIGDIASYHMTHMGLHACSNKTIGESRVMGARRVDEKNPSISGEFILIVFEWFLCKDLMCHYIMIRVFL